MTALERLRHLVHVADPDGTVTIRWLAEQLGEDLGEDLLEERDLTVEEVADQVQKAPSTVRAWLGDGKIEGAYRLRGKAWRIPVEGLRRFLEAEGRGRSHPPSPPAPVDIAAWRREQPNGRGRQ